MSSIGRGYVTLDDLRDRDEQLRRERIENSKKLWHAPVNHTDDLNKDNVPSSDAGWNTV